VGTVRSFIQGALGLVNPNKETNMTKATACAVDSPAKTKACPDENRTEKIAILAFLRWEQGPYVCQDVQPTQRQVG
jgi:hypothetical protein